MSQYTYVVDYAWVHTVEELNEMILSQEWPTLTSAEQIISIRWDNGIGSHLVTWRVRKWSGGGDGT